MTPADFRCKPSCESAGSALLTVFGLVLYTNLSTCIQNFSGIAVHQTRLLLFPFSLALKPTFHTSPNTRIRTDFTEVNSLFYLAIKHLLYAGSLDIGDWE